MEWRSKMLESKGQIAALFVPLALGLGVISIGDGLGRVVAGSEPLRCELRVTESGDRVVLEGVVVAKTAVEGSYRMQVSRAGAAGSSDINQGGDFSATPGAPSTLGTVTLDSGGSYSAKLKVTWTGGSIECSERVRGAL
jgi:hypothetical protein